MRYYEKIIMNRHSCRGFSPRKVEDKVINALLTYYEEEAVETPLVRGLRTELKFYVGTVWDELKMSVGYNGYCIKAPAYLVIYSEKGDHYLENAGCLGQALTLKLTEMGLAACWQTINYAEKAKKALGWDTDLEVVCVIAFGYRDKKNTEKPAPKKSLDDMTDGYIFGQDIDTGLFYRELEDGLRAVAHAQSFLNLQPYRIIVDNDQITLVGLPDDKTSEMDKHLNYGIVMFNFCAVAAATRNTVPKWSFEPVTDRDLKLPSNVEYVAKCIL